ncbi:hypothetical protein [Alloyangia pacifica]|uniref:hypothetical protein n=1 Tax=Alloyangia pacifica TaxID=311180 RepID=UPI001CD33FC6|nr:hypothetical protein [Alloyangia pacifica]MCA0996312.1 hypothetical protein [Alloyangia pacifica]
MTNDGEYMRLFRIKKASLMDYAKPPTSVLDATSRHDAMLRDLHGILRPKSTVEDEKALDVTI